MPSDATPASRGLRADARDNKARILAAAREMFADKGPAASTEEIAARAGVAVGTVFRHFPTKRALLQAIMKNLRLELADDARTLAAADDPAGALFAFFTRLVGQAASTKTVMDLLSETGLDLDMTASLQVLRDAVADLLANAQRAGQVRPEVEIDEVIALLAATSQGALHGGWSPDLQQRTLAIIFAGLRPAER